MAADVRLIRLTWENGVQFKMDTKLNDESYITILEMDENGHLHALWDNAHKLCDTFFHNTMEDIGKVMKT